MGFANEERIGIAVSIAIHLIFFAIVAVSKPQYLDVSKAIDVSFEPRPPQSAPKKQIVSPPPETAQKPPLNTDRLSDVDATAIKEQIQRGTNGGAPGPQTQHPPGEQASPQQPAPQQPPQKEPQPQKVAPKPPVQKEQTQKQPQQPQNKSEHALKELKLDDATLALRFGSNSKTAAPTQRNAAADLSNYAAFSRPPGSGAAFLGTAGMSDHLPNLPDGDITLLNAKANTYAGFVRRVAVQVFTQLRTQGWEQLNIREVRAIDGYTTIEAILSPDGKFIKLQQIQPSGSRAFDSVVQLAVSAGARDPNPPEGARASDGMIHFIFKAKSWAAMGVNNRSGGPVEHRWLLLATGLE